MGTENYSNDYQSARQHLSLSAAAREVLEDDRQDFGGGQSWAGILNHVFAVYRDTADASISVAVERRRAQYEEKLVGVATPAVRKAVLEALLADYTEELIKKAAKNGAATPNEELQADCTEELIGKAAKNGATSSKKPSSKFRLDRDNYAFREQWLNSPDAQYYGGRFSRYLRAVLQEYAAKTVYQREEVYFAEQLRLIQTSAANGELLRIRLKRGNEFEMRPYGVLSDRQETYHYLVGIACSPNDRAAERIACFRLFNLVVLKPSKKRSGRLTKEERDAIEDRIRSVGVQFLVQQQETICIRLTEQGRLDYGRQLHLRPATVKRAAVDDGLYHWEYTFNCTPFQAQAYFLKFCGEAKVIAPQSLRKLFADKYRSGLNAYQTPDTQGSASCE